MTLNKWDPLKDLLDFHERAHQTLYMKLPGAGKKRRVKWYPVVDVIETPEALMFRAELPGVGKDNINLEVEGTTLIISGTRNLESEPKMAVYHAIERVQGFFERRFTLPGVPDISKISATYIDGILEIVLPKASIHTERTVCVDCSD